MGEGEVEEDVHFMISPKQATSSHSKVGHRVSSNNFCFVSI